MSNAGLQGTLYGEIRLLSELVDAVIADLSMDARRTSRSRSELSKTLRELTTSGSTALLLRYVLPGSEDAARGWSTLPDALDQETAPAGLVDRLETLARILDRSRSAAFERLRGVGA
ncbi:hypothetical protein QA640_09840 [Bradyrhizobium sp. CB82]|uniref:hypothetical protein n=1 Tax=Bradyrhizobium sp. CB82 TaxID=3039159 RepID=UPI0024B1DF50|nr:hypothetical protein [Bradyrhizobium sp. CB82]WFU42729.1 hypothetical protein QA640_09840 [Bradyrhizobium sp. CB82]